MVYKKDISCEIADIIQKVRAQEITFIEEAEGYYCLLMEHGLTQQELADKIGRSQSAVANKIRLLKLPPLVRKIIDEYGLSERHARALLRLHDEQLQLKILKQICEGNIKVGKTEELIAKTIRKNNEYVDETLNKQKTNKPNEFSALTDVKKIFNDVRVFASNIKENVTELKEAGVKIKAAQFDRTEYFEFVIQIPKKENGIVDK